jgi:peptide/nickel transport system substrate-binding protein
LDKDPRERTPPREEPPAGGPIDRLQKLYDQAKVEPDDDMRETMVLDMIQIHVDEGPFYIGTVGNLPTVVVFHNNVGNVPTREQLGTGGFTNPWIMVYFGAVFPEQFYYKDQ